MKDSVSGIEVVAYFADDPTRVYQLLQWLPVLELLDGQHRVAVVTRDPATAAVCEGRTHLPVLLAEGFDELADLYDAVAPKVAVYCNNSPWNFQSLLQSRFLHVHVGHGESDKQSMASNNAKAYDRVFVAGEAAVQRHVSGLLEYDDTRLVRVGRPQLDLVREPLIAPSERRTVLYAPTWEGDADYNDYTSIDSMGEEIARAVLAVPDVRLVYKPHPKVVTSTVPGVRAGHLAVLSRLAEAVRAEPEAGHVAVTDGDILAVMPVCDAIVTDVSSVGLDWLYLRTDKPIVMTDRHGDADRLRGEVAVSRCADVVAADGVAGLAALLADRLDHDEHHLARVAVRRHYFDDLAIGESTTRFLQAVSDVVARRDELIGLPSQGSGAETA